MSKSQVRVWSKRFLSGETSVKDKPKFGRPRSQGTEANKSKIEAGATRQSEECPKFGRSDRHEEGRCLEDFEAGLEEDQKIRTIHPPSVDTRTKGLLQENLRGESVTHQTRPQGDVG